jgi:hypothetical protein
MDDTLSDEKADLTIVYLIHGAIRRDLAAFASLPAAEPSEAARSYWGLLSSELHHHHETEDIRLWPLLADRGDAGAAEDLERMEAQHRDAVALLDELDGPEGAFGIDPELVAQLAAIMGQHLDDEEESIFPLIQATMSEEEMASFGQRQLAEMSERQRGFFLPWILSGAPEEPVAHMRTVLPPPLVALIDEELMPSFDSLRSAALR